MKIANYLILTTMLLAPSVSSIAQKLSGVVTNIKGEAMPYATVYIEKTRQSAICDNLGRYEFTELPDGRYNVKASFIGYHTQSIDIDITQTKNIDFKLKEEEIQLDEYFVLPKGMNICQYIMQQLDKNIKPLSKRLAYYDCTTTARLEKHINLSELRKRKTIHFALSLLGWGKNFNTLVKYNDLTVKMSEEVKFRKGKITDEGLRIISTNPQITDSEKKSFCKKDWFLSDNSYDRFYDEVHTKIKALKSKKSKYKITYHGSYDEGNKTIYILSYGHTRIEIVDKCWQIRRMSYKSNNRTINFEFSELSPGVFLPISGHAEYNINYEGYPKGVVKLSVSYKYRNIKKQSK